MQEVCEYQLNEVDILSLAMYDMYYVIAPVSGGCLRDSFVVSASEGIIWVLIGIALQAQ